MSIHMVTPGEIAEYEWREGGLLPGEDGPRHPEELPVLVMLAEIWGATPAQVDSALSRFRPDGDLALRRLAFVAGEEGA